MPDIEPLIERLPFDVVTVQSPVCAEGFDRTVCNTSIFDVIAELLIVVESDDTEFFVTFSTFSNLPPDESALQFV